MSHKMVLLKCPYSVIFPYIYSINYNLLKNTNLRTNKVIYTYCVIKLCN